MDGVTAVMSEAECLETGFSLGSRIVEDAVWHGQECAFHGATINPTEDGTIVYRSFDGALYDGSSGIALALARLYRRFDDEALRRTALGALRHASRAGAGAGGLGLYDGQMGIALAARFVAEATGSDEADSIATRFETDLTQDFRADLSDAPFDLTSGLAGRIFALTYLKERASSPETGRRFVAHARRLGEALASSARIRPEGMSWPTDPDVIPTRDDLCGLAHGASGGALAFQSLAAASNCEGCASNAALCRKYERRWYDRRMSSWPDLREEACHDSGPMGAHFWCQGSVGIGLERLAATDPAGRADAAAAVAGVVEEARRVLHAAPGDDDFTLNLSLCHGLGGAIDFLVSAARIGHSELLELARALAGFGLQRRQALGYWPCGVANGTETPGLMLGLAGIAVSYLRAAQGDGYGSAAIPGFNPNGAIAAANEEQLASAPQKEKAKPIPSAVPRRVQRPKM